MFVSLFEFITNLIVAGGYPLIFLAMVLESMIFPIPSEAVMPFAGFLVAQGKLTWFYIIIASSLGSIVGSLVSYYIGYYGGRTFIEKYGKYFLLNLNHLKWTEQWFRSRGSATVFISRFIPIVRHVISIPAGMGKMNIKLFLLFTFIGSTLWNSFLVYIGFILNKNWIIVSEYSKQIDLVVIIIICIFSVFFVYRRLKKHKKQI